MKKIITITLLAIILSSCKSVPAPKPCDRSTNHDASMAFEQIPCDKPQRINFQAGI